MSRGLRIVSLLLAAVLIAGGALSYLAWRGWTSLHTPYPATGTVEPVTLEIEPGSSGTAILGELAAHGVIRDARLARLYLIHVLDDPALQAGEYRFALPQTTPDVLQQIIEGRVVTYPVTLIEGLTLAETAAHLAAEGFGDEDALLAAMADPSAIADLDAEAENLEGYLYPDTYSFPKGTAEAEVVATLVRSFRERFRVEVEPALEGDDRDLSVRDLVTLASIVEKEARLDEERPLIASVYSNRLRIGMGLYADPTIIYALKLAGTWDGNIRRRDLALDSPYNTYVHPGLPPSPIGSPGVRSLIAAANPAESPYFYFVSRNDGTHVFARTLAEHNRNVQRWQKEYWQRRWARERAERDAAKTPIAVDSEKDPDHASD